MKWQNVARSLFRSFSFNPSFALFRPFGSKRSTRSIYHFRLLMFVALFHIEIGMLHACANVNMNSNILKKTVRFSLYTTAILCFFFSLSHFHCAELLLIWCCCSFFLFFLQFLVVCIKTSVRAYVLCVQRAYVRKSRH